MNRRNSLEWLLARVLSLVMVLSFGQWRRIGIRAELTATTGEAAGDDAVVLQCPLHIFVPFTNNGTETTSITGEEDRVNPAFTALAAAILAADHFNRRDASVVPQLNDLGDCNVRLDLNRTFAFDTGTVGHGAAHQFVRQVGQTGLPCAVVGPLSDLPALELSVLALGAEIPMVVGRSNNERVVMDEFSPFTSQVWPDVVDTSLITAEFLLQRNRTDFVSLLYTVTDANIQRRELISWALDGQGITHDTHPMERNVEFDQDETQTPLAALRSVKERGFRTIVVCMENALLEFPAIAEAAEALGMNNGDYFWFWFGYFDPVLVYTDDPTYRKLFQGSALVLPIEEFWRSSLDGSADDPFSQAWNSAALSVVDGVNALNPLSQGDLGYVFAQSDFFRTNRPDWGAGYLFDAVMTIGIGACTAARQHQQNDTGIVTGLEHLNGIRSVDFKGSTGQVKFYNAQGRSGARLSTTLTFEAINLLPMALDETNGKAWHVSDVWYPDSDRWTTVAPFIYAHGRTVPPEFLRDPPDQNYISAGLQAFGLALMSTVFLAGTGAIIWVYIHRKNRVLAASQPVFLYTVAVGCIIEASTIFTKTFDESNGWSESSLTALCQATPWLISIGHIIVFGSLFSKLWRVNKVLQFARRKIEVRQVAWPAAILCLAALVVLSVWTAVYGETWERSEVNAYTGESIASCTGEHAGVFVGILLTLMLIPTLLTGFMAWKTKDVSDEFSEAKWIWMLFVVQLEVLLVAVPTIVILQDISANGRYLGMTIILWVFPMSTLVLILGPKVFAYYRALNGGQEIRSKRGERIGSTRVTGISSTSSTLHAQDASRFIPSETISEIEPSENKGTNSTATKPLQNESSEKPDSAMNRSHHEPPEKSRADPSEASNAANGTDVPDESGVRRED